MKFVCTFIIYITAQSCIAQKILVPYRSGKLFGLSDEKGKLVLKPAYDNVEWMTGTWFQTGKKIALKDTLETAPGKFYIRNTTAKITGLINNGRLVLNDEPFDAYEIVADKCIVAKFEGWGTDLTKEQFKKYGDKRKFYSLFNLQGKNLYPESFRRIQKMDTAGISSKHKNEARYILFWTTGFDDKHSLFVFDADEQEISDWLIKDAYKLQPDRKRVGNQIGFAITDSQMNSSTQLLDYSSGSFVFQPTAANGNSKTKERRYGNEGIAQVGTGSGEGPGDRYSDVAAPTEEGPGHPAPKFNPYHIFVKDSLFYITSYESRRPVKLPEGAKVILLEPRGMTQYQPVIARHENHFYIIAGEQPGTMAYDSLIYFGKYFLAWQKNNGQIKAGVINADGTVVIPLQYDSLYAGIRYFNLVDQNPAANTPRYQIVFKEADAKYNYDKVNPYNRSFNNLLTVFVNGKAGVISIKGDTVIPFKYQMIAKNNLGHMKPQKDEFIILKQNGRYGLTTLQYNREKEQNEMSSSTIAPIFEYIPGFYYPHYFGVKNYKLVGLYDEQFIFMGYATESGKLFYDNQ